MTDTIIFLFIIGLCGYFEGESMKGFPNAMHLVPKKKLQRRLWAEKVTQHHELHDRRNAP